MYRYIALAFLAPVLGLFAGCASSRQGPLLPLVTQTQTPRSAASDALGFQGFLLGRTAGAPIWDALGDSVTAPYPDPWDKPPYSIRTYPQVIAAMARSRHIPLDLHTLAVGGATIGYPSDRRSVLAYQVSRIDPNARFITIEAGVDEMAVRAFVSIKWGHTTPAHDAAAMLQEYRQAIALARAIAPKATIIVFNDANVGYYKCCGPATKWGPSIPWEIAGVRAINDLYDSGKDGFPALLVVNTACDGRSYASGNWTIPALGIHPSQPGQNFMARKLLDRKNVAPIADCPWLHGPHDGVPF